MGYAHLFLEFCIWNPLKEGEASFLFEWAGSFLCKVFGIISVQLLCCSRSLSCIAWAVHLISASAVNLMQMCWIYSFVYICCCACAVGICSVSLTWGNPSRRMSESTLLLPAVSFSWQFSSSPEGFEAGPWHRWIAHKHFTYSVSHRLGIPLSKEYGEWCCFLLQVMSVLINQISAKVWFPS